MKFRYKGEIFDEEGDALIHCLVDHSDDADDGTFVCKHCGEVLDENYMGMHLAYGHALVTIVEECRVCDDYQEVDGRWRCTHSPAGKILGESDGGLIIQCYKQDKAVIW